MKTKTSSRKRAAAPGKKSATGKAALAKFSSEIAPFNLIPLWERRMRMRPGSACVPALWRYAELRPLLMRSAELISKSEAERRVLVLENPSLRGTTFITHTLYCGLQVILPEEVAPSHRHSPAALRFIVEGEGAYTVVEGSRIPMRPGDFVVTPGWAWHDHGNLGAGPVVWMDGLDTPFAQFFGAMFREDGADGGAPAPRSRRDLVRAQLLAYPYERAREALETLSRNAPPHPALGYRRRYTDPGTGRDPFPTMAVFLQRLPAGFTGRRHRSTDGAIFNVVEGRGSVVISEARWDFAPHDVFVVPSWEFYQLNADADCVLFSYSDRAAQEALGFWREQNN